MAGLRLLEGYKLNKIKEQSDDIENLVRLNFTHKGKEIPYADVEYGIDMMESSGGKNRKPRYEPLYHKDLIVKDRLPKENKDKWYPTPAERRVIEERGRDNALKEFSTSRGRYQIIPETAYRYTNFKGEPEDLENDEIARPVLNQLLRRNHRLGGGDLEKSMHYWNNRGEYFPKFKNILNKDKGLDLSMLNPFAVKEASAETVAETVAEPPKLRLLEGFKEPAKDNNSLRLLAGFASDVTKKAALRTALAPIAPPTIIPTTLKQEVKVASDIWETAHKPERKISEAVGKAYEKLPKPIRENLLPNIISPLIPQAKQAEEDLQKGLLQSLASMPASPEAIGMTIAGITSPKAKPLVREIQEIIQGKAKIARTQGLKKAQEFLSRYSNPEVLREEIRNLVQQKKIIPITEQEINKVTGEIYNYWSNSLYKSRVAGAEPKLYAPEELLGARKSGLRSQSGQAYIPGPSKEDILKIANQFNLTQEQIKDISRGVYANIPAKVIDQLSGLTASKAQGETLPKEVVELSTGDLEQLIDTRYEVGASQEELDLLENEYAKRVVEDDLNMTEEEVNIAESTHQGADLEEQMTNMYHRYLNPSERNGMGIEDIIGNMRSAIETYGGKGTDEQILSAAKDIYEHKQKLIDRYKQPKSQPTEGKVMYHGTSAKGDFTSFKGDVVYLAQDAKEVDAFAKNPILGGGRGEGTPRVLKVNIPEGKLKDINAIVEDTIMNDGDLDAVVSEQAKIARKEGYDYLTFEHPSSIEGQDTFQATIAINPSKIKLSQPKSELGQPKAGGMMHELSPKDREKLKSMKPDVFKMVKLDRDVEVKMGEEIKKYKKGEEIYIYQDNATGRAIVKDGDYGILPKKEVTKVEQAGSPIGEFAPELTQLKVVVKGYGSESKRYFTDDPENPAQEPTKFGHALPIKGGEKYREVLITVPKNELKFNKPFDDFMGEMKNKYGETDALKLNSKMTIDERRMRSKLGQPTRDVLNSNFKSSHWDESNPIVWNRYSEFKTPDGKKVLMLLESQPISSEGDEATAYLKSTGLDAHDLSMKQALIDAVNGNFEYLAWTTPQQQKDLYNLAKQVDNVTIKPSSSPAQGKYFVEALKFIELPNGQKRTEVVIAKFAKTDKELARIVGKNLAQKAINDKADAREQIYQGDDLKIGGGWADSKYGIMIPKSMRKLSDEEITTIKIEGNQLNLVKALKLLREGKKLYWQHHEGADGYVGIETKDDLKEVFELDDKPEVFERKFRVKQTITIMPEPTAKGGKAWFILNEKGNPVELLYDEDEAYDRAHKLNATADILEQPAIKITPKLKMKVWGQPMAGGESADVPELRKEDVSQVYLDKLTNSEKNAIQKLIIEGKSIQEAATELGLDPEDMQKDLKWAVESYRQVEADSQQEMQAAMEDETAYRRSGLKNYLKGQFKPELKTQGEYADLKNLDWLFAKEGGRTPDDMVGELSQMGFPLESDTELLELIRQQFGDEILNKASTMEATKTRQVREKLKRDVIKATRTLPTKFKEPEVQVGRGTILSTPQDTDRSMQRKILHDMPFTLLGNKSEVLARLSPGLKRELTKDIELVYDMFGGAKGYRAGLFTNLPSANYSLNEFSDERFNYYKNLQNPQSVEEIKNFVKTFRNGLLERISEAFAIDRSKFTEEEMNRAINKWLTRGLNKERYEFTRRIIENYGNALLREAVADNFKSPRSSAIYYFLQNTSIFGISKDAKGYHWSQGLIRTSADKAQFRDNMYRIENVSQQLDKELNRDKNMPLTQEDAWLKIEQLVSQIQVGTVDASKIAVMVDPQYLNPTAKEGTYSVGQKDASWLGHKDNLEKYLMPLINTGARIIYTNNDDINLINWLKEKKLPYNTEQGIGKVAKGEGRDEIISFINYQLPEVYTSKLPSGAGEVEPEQQYLGKDITGESPEFQQFLKEYEARTGQKLTKEQIEILRSERLKTIAGQLNKLAEIAPRLITPKQLAYIHILKEKNYLTDRQFSRLKRIYANKKSLGVTTATGRLKKNPAMKEEGAALIRGQEGIVQRKPVMTGQPPVIPRNKSLMLSSWAGPFNDLTEMQAVPLSGLDPVRAGEIVDGKRDGVVSKTVVQQAQKAEHASKLELKQILDNLTKVSQSMPTKSKESKILFKYIEQTLNDVEKKFITDRITLTADYMRKVYKDLLIRVNNARIMLGKIPILERQFYITHLFELSLLDDFFQGISNIPDNMVNVPAFSKSSSPFFKFALQRTGGKDFQEDAIKAFSTYVSRALAVIHNTPVLKSARPLVDRLPHNAYKYFTQYLDETMALRPSQVDKLLPHSVISGVSWLRRQMGKGAILGNIASTFNQVFTLPNIVAASGPRFVASAALKMTNDTWRAFTERYSSVLQGRIFEIDFDPTLLSKVDKALGFLIQYTDREMVRLAFGAAFEQAIDMGMTFEEAVRYADNIAFKTQAGFGSTEIPPAFRSKIAASFLQFQVTVNNGLNYLKFDLGKEGPERGKWGIFKAALMWLGTLFALNKIYKEFGIQTPIEEWTDVFPLVSMAEYGPPATYSVPWAIIQRVVAKTPQDKNKAMRSLYRSAFLFVPGGNQFRKTFEGIYAISKGGKFNKKGRLLFPIRGIPEQIRATVFGPYGTKAGQEYIDRGFKPVPKPKTGKLPTKLGGTKLPTKFKTKLRLLQ